jgi:AraC-like DNA-binding protein
MDTMADDVEQIVSPPARRPHPTLRPYVDGYHGYHYLAPPTTVHRGLPSSALTVVVAFGRPLDLGWHDEPPTRGEYWAVASGLHVKAAEIFHESEQCGVQLGLSAAGARALIGLPMAALARQMTPLDTVLPARLCCVVAQVAEEPTWKRRYDALDSILLTMLAARGESDLVSPRRELSWAWRELSRGRRVDAVAADLGWSRRHLSAQFGGEVGLPPKQFARVARFQRSRRAVAGGLPAGEVAAECGFADQPHLIREWRAMAGYTPSEWLRAEFPFLQDLTATEGALSSS